MFPMHPDDFRTIAQQRRRELERAAETWRLVRDAAAAAAAAAEHDGRGAHCTPDRREAVPSERWHPRRALGRLVRLTPRRPGRGVAPPNRQPSPSASTPATVERVW